MSFKSPARQLLSSVPLTEKTTDPHNGLIPGLPEDIAEICIALVPQRHFSAMGAVSWRWRSFIGSREFSTIRKEVRRAARRVHPCGGLTASCFRPPVKRFVWAVHGRSNFAHAKSIGPRYSTRFFRRGGKKSRNGVPLFLKNRLL
jgi:hypothetical protein